MDRDLTSRAIDVVWLAWWLLGLVPRLSAWWGASMIVGSYGLALLAPLVPSIGMVTTGVWVLDWTLALLAYDAIGYAVHRWVMHSRLGWWAHRFHHSGTAYWPLLGLREHPASMAINGLWKPAILGAIGAPAPLDVHREEVQADDHTDGQRAAGLVVTPAWHRVHHSVHERHHGANYGGLLTVWDRLLGTHDPDVGLWPVGLQD